MRRTALGDLEIHHRRKYGLFALKSNDAPGRKIPSVAIAFNSVTDRLGRIPSPHEICM